MPTASMKISRDALHELIDSIHVSYGVQGENIEKTKFLILKERQARARIYREILGELSAPALFAFFAYLSLADGALFYDYFDDQLQQKVAWSTSGGPTGDEAAIAQHAMFSWMYEAYVSHEFSREHVKTPEFWMRFISGECERMIATYDCFDANADCNNATISALKALRRYIAEKQTT